MNDYALTFVSKDQPGIVARVSEVLFDKGFNIADSSSTILSGVFCMILLVQHESEYTVEEIKSFFKPAGFNPAVNIIAECAPEQDGEHYVISVYGADKPGIVHNITKELYSLNINIKDLQTQMTGSAGKEVYIMILEVVVPADTEKADWQKQLAAVAKNMGTDITVRHIETYEL